MLEDSLRKTVTHVGRVEVAGDPTGAEVLVNGRTVGRLPLTGPVLVNAGVVDVEIRAPGYAAGARALTVVPGQYEQIVIRLAKEPPSSPGSAGGSRIAETPNSTRAVSPRSPVSTSTSLSPQVQVTETPSSESASASEDQPSVREDDRTPEEGGPATWRGVAKWTALGGAVAALGFGIFESIVHERKVSEFQSLKDPQGGERCSVLGNAGVDGSGNADPACQTLLDTYRTAQTRAIIGYVGAGVLTALWVVLMFTEPQNGRPAGQHAEAPWTCAPSVAELGIGCRLRF